MSYKTRNSLFDKVTLPTVADGDLSRTFVPPTGAKVLAIHCPDLAVNATLTIQSAAPTDSDVAAETWRAVSAVVITATIGFCALTTIPDNAVTTIPVAALGGGAFRFLLSAAQAGSAVDSQTILLEWGLEG